VRVYFDSHGINNENIELRGGKVTQLELLKLLLGNPSIDDAVLQYCLDTAKDIICDLRFTDEVEPQYINIQTKIAIEIFNKLGAEGQIQHTENGISRTYEKGDISDSLLCRITPFAKTPYSTVRVVNP